MFVLLINITCIHSGKTENFRVVTGWLRSSWDRLIISLPRSKSISYDGIILLRSEFGSLFTLHSFASSSGLWKQFFWSQECFIEAALAFALSYLCTLQARIRLTVSQSFMSYLLTPSRGRKLLNELGVLIWPIAYMLRILFQSQTSKISHEESTCSNNTYANLVKLSSSTEQLDTKAHTFISANSDSFTIK